MMCTLAYLVLSSGICSLSQLAPTAALADPDPVPIPEGMYPGECPFQKWFSGLPSHYGLWENLLIGKYFKAWEKAGKPVGIRKDDHDYDTALGQGNTLGFLPARLTLNDGPSYTKHGLFAETGTLPAVVRLSDFGSDDSTLRLSRMSVKVPMRSAWGGEVNLLFTETIDSFPLADYGELSAFAADANIPWYERIWDKLKMAASGLIVGVKDAITVYEALKVEPLAKKYYSQLPYMLGESQAMKFQLIPKQQTCSGGGPKRPKTCCLPATAMPSSEEAPSWATNRAHVAANYLKHCDAVFELQLQVKEFHENQHTVLHRADASWHEMPVTVGTLTIPQQDATPDWAVGRDLQSALATELGVEPQGIDKLFAFHPILTHTANRPVGDINSFRGGFYSVNANERFHTIHKGVFKKSDGTPLRTVQQMPFTALQKAGVFGQLPAPLYLNTSVGVMLV